MPSALRVVRAVRRVLCRGAALAVACAAAPALAQSTTADGPDAPGVPTLDEVVVKGQLLRAADAPYTAVTLETVDVRELAVSQVDQLFAQVPGMAVRDLQLGGVANSIVIRDFGGGGHGGDLGAVLDGIPLNEAMSHADGYFDLNVLVPLEIAGFTVYKGAVSPLYGNFNRGGLLAIETRKGGEYAELDVAAGSFGLLDLQGAWGGALTERQRVNLAGHLHRGDGFRRNSRGERGTLAGRWTIDVAPQVEVAVSARWHAADHDSAAYLLRSQFLADPRGIDPRVQNDGADKRFATARTDLNYTVNDDLKLLSWVYGTRQQFTRWFSRPVSASAWAQREETYHRSVNGLGASLNGRLAVAGATWNYVVGLETIRESTEYQFHDGLRDRTRVNPALANRDTRLDDVAAFAELEAPLHPLAQLTLGLRADRFDGGCRRLGPEAGSDPCGPLNDPRHVSPKVGLRSAVAPWLTLRASWAEGFALPNGFVKYSVGGQPLDETVFRQTEVGATLSLGGTVDFDLAAWRIESDGEVRTVSPGVFENFGATRRQGLDASLRWRPFDALTLTTSWGVARTEILNNANAALVGRRVAGVPAGAASVDVEYAPLPAWSFTAGWRYVGRYDLDAANSQTAESYALLGLGLAYLGEGRWPYRAYLRIENAGDEPHATNELLLAGQRAVAPGAPRSVRAGLQFGFR